MMGKRIELTPRLQAVAAQVPAGARLADVGTDHAYLPVSLILEGKIPSAIAADLRSGPLDRARHTAEEYGCTDRVSFRLCDGLRDIHPGEADAVSIAGMGGETISGILSAAEWVKENNLTLILQPMSTQPELRGWLWHNGYVIEHEDLAREGDTLYVILRVKAGRAAPVTPAQEWAGCQRREDVSPLRGEYLDLLLNKVRRVMEGIARSKEGSAGARYQELCEVCEGLENMKKEWETWQV